MFRYSLFLDTLIKAMTHKYIRRVPKGVTKTGATKYAYFYAGQEGHGKGVAHESELIEGSAFAFGEHGKTRYHAHISKVDGDKITVKYDDGAKKGQEETMTKKQFQDLVHGEHKEAIKQAQTKAEKQLKDFKAGKEKGVKVKQETIDKLEQRVKNLDALTRKQEPVKTKTLSKKSNINLSELPASDLLTTLQKLTNKAQFKGMPSPKTHMMYDVRKGTLYASNGEYAIIVKDVSNLKASPDIKADKVFLDPDHIEQLPKQSNDISLDEDNVLEHDSLDRSIQFLDTALNNNRKENYATLNIPSDVKDAILSIPKLNSKDRKTQRSDIIFVHNKDQKVDLYHVVSSNTTGLVHKEKLGTIPAQSKKVDGGASFSFNTDNLKVVLPFINSMSLGAGEYTPATFQSADSKTDALLMPTRFPNVSLMSILNN